MLASIFIAEGVNALRDPDRLVQRAKPVTDRLAPTLKTIHPKVPTDPKTLVRINGGTQVVGGLLLATGRAPTPAAVALAASLVPTTYAGHPFWTVDDPEQRRLQRILFLKNVGLLGGLIFAALDNEGRPSLTWRAKHGTKHAVKAARHNTKHAVKAARHNTKHAVHNTQHAVRSARRQAKIALLTAKDKLPTGS
jgi:putative oxidoreductase